MEEKATTASAVTAVAHYDTAHFQFSPTGDIMGIIASYVLSLLEMQAILILAPVPILQRVVNSANAGSDSLSIAEAAVYNGWIEVLDAINIMHRIPTAAQGNPAATNVISIYPAQLLSEAARGGHMAAIEHIMSRFKPGTWVSSLGGPGSGKLTRKDFNFALGGAALGPNVDCVSFMLSHGARVVNNALKLAAGANRVEAINVLAAAGATCFSQALQIAMSRDSLDAASVLIPHVRGIWRIIYVAACTEDEKFIAFIADYFESTGCQRLYRWHLNGALRLAAEQGHRSIIQCLMRVGASDIVRASIHTRSTEVVAVLAIEVARNAGLACERPSMTLTALMLSMQKKNRIDNMADIDYDLSML